MDAQQLLQQAVGEWDGEYFLWFQPEEPAVAQSATRATITSELRGGGVLLRYDWRYDDDVHEGLAIISSTEDGGLQMGWTDTFHYAHGVLHCDAVGSAAAALGQFGPTEEPWGWRTEFDMLGSDSLEVRAYAIKPDGSESLATRAVYRRTLKEAS